jgi:nitrogen fixation protein FixH
MAGNPIVAEVSDKFGATMIRMPVGFYGLGLTSDLMRTWNAWYSLSMQVARLTWDAQSVVALRCMQIVRENARGRQSETHRMLTEKITALTEAQAAGGTAAAWRRRVPWPARAQP